MSVSAANTMKVGPHGIAPGKSVKGPTFKVFAP